TWRRRLGRRGPHRARYPARDHAALPRPAGAGHAAGRAPGIKTAMRTSSLIVRRGEMSILQKVTQVNWGLVLLLTTVASVGFAALYSAAGGSFEPWAGRQMARFAVGVSL